MAGYADFHRRSLQDRAGFWAEQAEAVHWHRPFTQVCDESRPPFVRWFVDGQTNLCHNAVDRHVAERGDQAALIWVSTETDQERVYSYRQLLDEVTCMAAVLLDLGVARGDRVLVYLPMVPEAVFVMLACARIGAVHSVVFGGFASDSLARRIDDATPRLVISADAGSRGGKVVPYKPLLDQALRLSVHQPQRVLLIDRGLAPMARVSGRDVDHAPLRERHAGRTVPCEWLASDHPSYTLYTSGTTGRPKGVQRDTGGYAVALAASMRHIFEGRAGETFFSTSDIGWVVGHSYIVHGPLLAGMATVLYEGLPIRPDAAVWWRLVERHCVSVMFTSPTAVRLLRKHGGVPRRAHDLSGLRTLFLAGEPLDEPTARWVGEAVGTRVVDNYWQTETGWPVLSVANGVERDTAPPGAAGRPLYGYDVRLVDERTGTELTAPHEKGVLVVRGPLPPGCMQTLWRDDQRFVDTYWRSLPGPEVYNTFDWATRDEAGWYTILGRTDDVINTAGHRIGTREVEEAISHHPGVSEVAVVGMAHEIKGQVAVAFVVLRDAGVADGAAPEADILAAVDARLGPVARPARVWFVPALPKTRSGKLLRRALQALCEGRDPGDLTTLEDPAVLSSIRHQLGAE